MHMSNIGLLFSHIFLQNRRWHVTASWWRRQMEQADEVLQVLRGGPMPQGWNETTIVLIPKVQKPEQVKDLRPISLCNVLYKIISKVLSNRLKQVLPDHYGKLNICRVPNCLPWAKTRAHGKGNFSRVPQMKLTANNRHTAKDSFAVCSRTRHTANNNNTAKIFKP